MSNDRMMIRCKQCSETYTIFKWWGWDYKVPGLLETSLEDYYRNVAVWLTEHQLCFYPDHMGSVDAGRAAASDMFELVNEIEALDKREAMQKSEGGCEE